MPTSTAARPATAAEPATWPTDQPSPAPAAPFLGVFRFRRWADLDEAAVEVTVYVREEEETTHPICFNLELALPP